MRVLVTGHNGYIGAVMTPFLRAAGHDVVGLDTYFYESCSLPVGEENHAPAIRKDIRDVTADDLEGFDAVAHLAALCNDPLGDMNPELTDDINYRASVRLATAAKQAGVKRFIYASSCSLYGAASADEILTENAPFNPLTPYALSKIRTEESVSELADDHFSPVFMRNATAYGLSPRLRADIVLNNLVCWAHTTGRIRIMSDGSPWRPIVHIEDISRAFAAALSAPREAIHNEAFNVGVNDENYQVREIAEIVRQTVPDCTVEYAAQSGPDPRNYRVEFSKILRALPDFQPQWNARRGARELHDAFVQIGFSEEDFQGRKFTRLKQLSHLLEVGRLDESLRWKDSTE